MPKGTRPAVVSRHVAASRRHPTEHMKLQFLGVVVAFLPEASFAMCTRQPFPASVSASLCFLAWSSIQSPQLRMWPGCVAVPALLHAPDAVQHLSAPVHRVAVGDGRVGLS